MLAAEAATAAGGRGGSRNVGKEEGKPRWFRCLHLVAIFSRGGGENQQAKKTLLWTFLKRAIALRLSTLVFLVFSANPKPPGHNSNPKSAR